MSELDKAQKLRVILAISGGIAAYKCPELIRLFVKQGVEVRVVMTHAAQAFVTPLTLQALSGSLVYTELLSPTQEYAMGHIELARWADVLLIAPATANIIAKLSHGLADDMLSTLYLAVKCPVFVAPAMNQAMWHKPITQDNIARLRQYGVNIIGPEAGEQACGDQGLGRMSEPVAICSEIFKAHIAKCLVGKSLLLTAGPTREPIDPVRYISNRSSGKMGYALAAAALKAGARRVVLVSGPVNMPALDGVEVHRVETAAEMYASVMAQVADCDIFIGAAAVADYTPRSTATEKIKKQADETVLVLERTPDILAAVAKLTLRPFTVGFAAETHALEQYAQSKLQQKNLDMIAANWVGRSEGGFEHDLNALEVYWSSGSRSLPMMSKTALAEELITIIAEILNVQQSENHTV